MKKQTRKKILLAVDGSDSSLDAVRYVSKIHPFQKTDVVLFNVLSKIPESYWDLEKEPGLKYRIREVRAMEKQEEKNTREFMGKASKVLWRSGFPKDSVKVNIHERKKGIARDIINESELGYSCVVVGRKGMSALKDMVLGSVPAKLIEKLSFIPLTVVGKNPRPGSALLALDGSENSMRIVGYVENALGGPDFKVTLIHVIRSKDTEYLEKVEKSIRGVFDEAKTRLIKSGFESSQITTKIITGAHSRAGAIIKEAKEGGYGTIIVGRRGLSKVQEFFMGRVSSKVIQLAKGHAVWVVS